MILTPAIIVHDALIAFAKANDIEKLYDHYQESFYNYLDRNYGFRFPFDLEIACTYFDKIILGKDKENRPRHYTVSGTHRSIAMVIERVQANGKKVEFLDPEVNLEVIKSRIDNNYDPLTQYVKGAGEGSYDRDFSSGYYGIKFTD